MRVNYLCDQMIVDNNESYPEVNHFFGIY